MTNLLDIIGGSIIGVVLIVVILLQKKLNNNIVLDKKYYQKRWQKIQKMCSDKRKWHQAIISADDLLDQALKQRHFKGKTPGERLVSAQHYFTSNDSLWLSHKLKNKIKDEGLKKLNKQQTIKALKAYRLALIDINAIATESKERSKNVKR